MTGSLSNLRPFRRPHFVASGGSGFSFIDSVSGGSSNTNSAISDEMDTTNANLFVAAVANLDASSLPATVTDAMGNTWFPLTGFLANPGTYRCQFFYCVPSSVGEGHTFTATRNGTYPAITVAAFSGANASPADQENGADEIGTSTRQPGSITPSVNNSLIITGFAVNGSPVTASIDSGFTITDQLPFSSGAYFGVGMAYLIQGTALPVNPTWNFSGSPGITAQIASFKPA